jgi:subtilase family serine protease
MKRKNVFAWFIVVMLLSSLLGTVSAAPKGVVSPMLQKGPQAQPLAAAAGTSYGLFTCQVGQSSVTCYDPYQMQHAYGVDNLIKAGYNGKGRTIVIVDAFQSPDIVNDLGYFTSFYGLPGLNGMGNPKDASLGTFTQVAPDGLTPFDPADDNMQGWAGEITLDVEWAHAIAPGANITLVLAKSNDDADILSATQYAVDHNLGDVISQSFGEDERCVDSKILAAEHKLFVQATMKRISLFASAGDDGASQPTCDGSSYSKAASSPASDPLVTGVGGTELHAAAYCLASLGCDPAANPAAGTYQDEIVWNELDNSVGTGGGFSVLYKSPFLETLLSHNKQRGVPDVSYNAAIYHGVLTYFQGGFWLFGGTSAGSPQWAAIAAIADQKAGKRLGYLNAALYMYSILPKMYNTFFHDVTSGNNTFIAYDDAGNPVLTVEGYSAGKGWDATTGLGSPKADALVNFLTRYVTDNDGPNAVKGSDPFWSGRSGDHHMGH